MRRYPISLKATFSQGFLLSYRQKMRCERCGKCCHYEFKGKLKPCKHLVKLPSGKTLCRIWKQHLNTIIDEGIICLPVSQAGGCKNEFIWLPVKQAGGCKNEIRKPS